MPVSDVYIPDLPDWRKVLVDSDEDDDDELMDPTDPDVVALLGFDPLEFEKGFDPNQPRDEGGRWTTTGAVQMYHGTTDQFLEAIAKEGLKLNAPTRNWGESLYEGDRAQSVYVTDNVDNAKTYARQADSNGNGNPVVLKIRIPENVTLLRDEQDVGGGSWRLPQDIPPDWIVSATVRDYSADTVPYWREVPLSKTAVAGEQVLYLVVLVDGVEKAFDPSQPRDDRGRWSPTWSSDGSAQWPGKMSLFDQDSGRVEVLVSAVEAKLEAGLKPKPSRIGNPTGLLATQSWLTNMGGGGDPVFYELTKYPVLARTKDMQMHILDGHHRVARAIANDEPVRAYVIEVDVAEKAFDPNQPRNPAGEPGGGQWTGEGRTFSSEMEGRKAIWDDHKVMVSIDPNNPPKEKRAMEQLKEIDATLTRLGKDFPGVTDYLTLQSGMQLVGGKLVRDKDFDRNGALATYSRVYGYIKIAASLRNRTSKLKEGDWIVGGDGFDAVLRHELGHAVENKFNTAARATNNFGVKLPAGAGSVMEHVANISRAKGAGKKLSMYGATNGREYFAESFSAYTHPDYGKSGSALRIDPTLEKMFDAAFKGAS